MTSDIKRRILPSHLLRRWRKAGRVLNVAHSLAKLQSKLKEKVETNKEYFGLSSISVRDTPDAEVEDKGSELELSAGNKVVGIEMFCNILQGKN